MNIPLIKMLEREGIQLIKEQEKAAGHKVSAGAILGGRADGGP